MPLTALQVFITIVDKHRKVIDQIISEMKENTKVLFSNRAKDEKYRECRVNSLRLLMELYKSGGTSKLPAVTGNRTSGFEELIPDVKLSHSEWIKQLLSTTNKFLV